MKKAVNSAINFGKKVVDSVVEFGRNVVNSIGSFFTGSSRSRSSASQGSRRTSIRRSGRREEDTVPNANSAVKRTKSAGSYQSTMKCNATLAVRAVGDIVKDIWDFIGPDETDMIIFQTGVTTGVAVATIANPLVAAAVDIVVSKGDYISKLLIRAIGKRAGNALKLPANIDNAGKFVSWSRQFEKAKKPLSKSQVDQLIAQAKKFGVKVEASANDLAGHTGKAGDNWGIPHIHIGDARVHIPVPKGYKLK